MAIVIFVSIHIILQHFFEKISIYVHVYIIMYIFKMLVLEQELDKQNPL